MEIDFKQGFTVFRNNSGPVYVVPHSGPAFETPTSRDENAETVASLCWLKTKGTLIVSNLSRKRVMGVDFNRDAPPKGLAIKFWQDFLLDENRKELEEYREKYAFVAENETDYYNRLKLYNEFWDTIKNSDEIIVFIHRKFTRLKNFPSIMDIVIHQGYGINREIINPIIKEINEKYKAFFQGIANHYKSAIFLEELRVVDRIREIFSEFNLEKMKIEYREHILDDLKLIKKYADPRITEKLKNNFNINNFTLAIKSALKSEEIPLVTIESIFKGNHAMEQKRQLFGKKILIEIESNAFINYWYPNKATEIITEILDKIKSENIN